MTIDMMGQVTTPVPPRSQGTSGMMNHPVMGATNTQAPVMGTNATNTLASPPFYSLGEPSREQTPGGGCGCG